MPGLAQFGLLPVALKMPGTPQAAFQASGPPSCRAQLHKQVQQCQRQHLHPQSGAMRTKPFHTFQANVQLEHGTVE